MRVLLVSDNYLPNRDGIAGSVVSLATGLRELGHDVAVLVPRVPLSVPGLEHDAYLTPSLHTGYGDYRFCWPLPGPVKLVFEHHRPDVVHIHTLGSLGVLAAARCRRLGIRCVLSWHTDLLAYREAYPALNFGIPLIYLASLPRRNSTGAVRVLTGAAVAAATGKDVTSYHRRMLAGVLRLFDAFIVPSGKTASQLNEMVPVRPVHVVPTAPVGAPSLDAGSRHRLELLRRELFSGEGVIVFVGRLSPEKNLPVLLRALADHVLPVCPDVRLNVVGGGGAREDYERLTRALGIAHAVAFSGALPRNLVGHVLGWCAVLAHPSLTETQGLVIAEAALAGIPAVVLDPGLEGVVRHDHTGLVATSEAAFGACLAQLMRRPEITDRLGENARRAAREYTPTRYAAEAAAVYREKGAAGRARPAAAWN